MFPNQELGKVTLSKFRLSNYRNCLPTEFGVFFTSLIQSHAVLIQNNYVPRKKYVTSFILCLLLPRGSIDFTSHII